MLSWPCFASYGFSIDKSAASTLEWAEGALPEQAVDSAINAVAFTHHVQTLLAAEMCRTVSSVCVHNHDNHS